MSSDASRAAGDSAHAEPDRPGETEAQRDDRNVMELLNEHDDAVELQAAFEHVYIGGRYARRIRYDRPCDPPLTPEEQGWAEERIRAFRLARPDLFPT